MAASDARNTAAAINAAVASAGHRYPSPQQRRWKGYMARYWCFKSQKREKRIVPASRSEAASGPVQGWPAGQAGLGLAPPSSPASFINSSAQSPASFTLSLSAVSASMFSPGPRNTMFTIGPYAHETQLVSPPVFSTFTTEPSTAPFTPPPELAHLTTPSSPDVPFAQYIASSLEAKKAARDISPLSSSTLASPCDTPMCYTPTSGHLYLGSPLGRLVLPSFACRRWDVALDEKSVSVQTASFPSLNENGVSTQTASFPSYDEKAVSAQTASFPSFDAFKGPSLDPVPFAALILPYDMAVDEGSSLAGHGCTSSNHVVEDSLKTSGATDKSIKSGEELDLNHIKRTCRVNLSSELTTDDMQERDSLQQLVSSNGVCCDYKGESEDLSLRGCCEDGSRILLPETRKYSHMDVPANTPLHDFNEIKETGIGLLLEADERSHMDVPAQTAVHVCNEIDSIILEKTGTAKADEYNSHMNIPAKIAFCEMETIKVEETAAGHLGQITAVAHVEA